MPKIKISKKYQYAFLIWLTAIAILPFAIHFIALQSEEFKAAKDYLSTSKKLAEITGESFPAIDLPWFEEFYLGQGNTEKEALRKAFFTMSVKTHSAEILVYTNLEFDAGVWAVKSARVNNKTKPDLELLD